MAVDLWMAVEERGVGRAGRRGDDEHIARTVGSLGRNTYQEVCHVVIRITMACLKFWNMLPQIILHTASMREATAENEVSRDFSELMIHPSGRRVHQLTGNSNHLSEP